MPKHVIFILVGHPIANSTLKICKWNRFIKHSVYKKCIGSAFKPSGPFRPELIPVSVHCSMKWLLGIFLLPLGWDASLPQGYPQYLFIHVARKRHCESKVSSQEHSTVSQLRAGTRTAWYIIKCTNHDVTTPPHSECVMYIINKINYCNII